MSSNPSDKSESDQHEMTNVAEEKKQEDVKDSEMKEEDGEKRARSAPTQNLSEGMSNLDEATLRRASLQPRVGRDDSVEEEELQFHDSTGTASISGPSAPSTRRTTGTIAEEVSLQYDSSQQNSSQPRPDGVSSQGTVRTSSLETGTSVSEDDDTVMPAITVREVLQNQQEVDDRAPVPPQVPPLDLNAPAYPPPAYAPRAYAPPDYAPPANALPTNAPQVFVPPLRIQPRNEATNDARNENGGSFLSKFFCCI